jgi:hypothetical protein
MIRKPRKISTFDTRFFVLFVFAASFYHYAVQFILIDTQYVLRAPYVAARDFIMYSAGFLPKPESIPCPGLKLTELTTHLPSSSVPVLQYFDTGWTRTLFIPRKNFNMGDIVVFNNCLVGRITKMGKQIASVQLITDKASCVPIVFEDINGIASGKDGQTIQINRLQKSLNKVIETRVYTSGIDGVFPKNLLVGFVTRTAHNKALVKSCFDFKKLNHVDVISYAH